MTARRKLYRLEKVEKEIFNEIIKKVHIYI